MKTIKIILIVLIKSMLILAYLYFWNLKNVNEKVSFTKMNSMFLNIKTKLGILIHLQNEILVFLMRV